MSSKKRLSLFAGKLGRPSGEPCFLPHVNPNPFFPTDLDDLEPTLTLPGVLAALAGASPVRQKQTHVQHQHHVALGDAGGLITISSKLCSPNLLALYTTCARLHLGRVVLRNTGDDFL